MNRNILLFTMLIVAAFVLVGCGTGPIPPPGPDPSDPIPHEARDARLADSILSKVELNSAALTQEEADYMKGLVEKALNSTDATFTSKEVKILLMYFGVLSPQKLLPERTAFSAPLPNVDNAVIDRDSNSINVPFRNNKGVAITLPLTGTVTPQSGTTCNNPKISGTYDGAAIVAGTTQIPNGGGFIIQWDCDDLTPVPAFGTEFKADLTFQYTNIETGQLLTHTGMTSTKYG